MSARKWWKAAGALLAFALLEAALSVAFYRGVTHDVPGANDFYVPWRATQALVREGRNPYSDEVTRDIQIGMFGKARGPDEHPFGYAYPLFTSILLAPFAWLPYDAAQAVWYALLLPLLLGSGLVLLQNLQIAPNRPALVALALWTVSFYPATRALILGQLAIVVCACVVLAWWAVRHRHDPLGGALLALAMVKPQMVFLILPLVLVWAWQNHRQGILAGFGAVFGSLLLISILILPYWPLDFLNTTRAYAGYFDSQSPVEILLRNDVAALGLSLMIVLLWLGAAAHCALHGWRGMTRLCMWAIIVTQLIAIHTATTNQLMLMLPIFYGLSRAHGLKWGVVLVAFLAVPWLVFLATKQGNTENALALLPISIGVAGWWLVDAVSRASAAGERELAT